MVGISGRMRSRVVTKVLQKKGIELRYAASMEDSTNMS